MVNLTYFNHGFKKKKHFVIIILTKTSNIIFLVLKPGPDKSSLRFSDAKIWIPFISLELQEKPMNFLLKKAWTISLIW